MSMKSSSVRNRPAVWNSPNPSTVMLANRSRLTGPTASTSAKKKTPSSANASVSMMNRTVSSVGSNGQSSVNASPSKSRRPEWNNYLTENDRFKVTPDEIRKKKKMMISKHNVIATLFHSDDEEEQGVEGSSPRRPSRGSAISGTPSSAGHNKSGVSELTMSSGQNDRLSGDVNSLDLLVLNSDHEGEEDESEEGEEGEDVVDHDDSEGENMEDGDVEKQNLVTTSTDKNTNVGKKKIVNKKSVSKKSTTVGVKKTVGTKKAPVVSPDVRKNLFPESESEDDEQGSEYGFNERDRLHKTGRVQYNLVANKQRFNQTSALKSAPAPSPATKSSIGSPSTSVSNSHRGRSTAFFSPKDAMSDRDLKDIAYEIKTLLDEIKYYEELSGQRPILLSSDELHEVISEEELLDNYHELDQKRVIRFLVQLSCQTMTHLLKKELEHQTLQAQIDLLTAKFNDFTSTPLSTPGVYGGRYLPSPGPATSVKAPSLRPPSVSSVQLYEHNLTPAIPPPPRSSSSSGSAGNSPKSPSSAKFPASYVNPYESYLNSDDVVPPPPPPPIPNDGFEDDHYLGTDATLSAASAAIAAAAGAMPELDHWIEYSKRIGVTESVEAFNTMQQLTSTTQRVPAPSSYAIPSLASTTAALPTTVTASTAANVSLDKNSQKAKTVPGLAQEAFHELNGMSSMPAFTGTSPTDLLFMFNNAASVNPSAITGTPLNTGDDYALSPHAAAELAARTYDLYAEKIMPSSSSAKGVQNVGMRQPQQYQGSTQKAKYQKSPAGSDNVASSYDAMIDRLSYNLTNGLKTNTGTSVPTGASNPAKATFITRNEEQPSMVDPKSQVPTPISASIHPLKSRITASDYVHTKMDSDVFDTRKQLFEVSPEFREKRIYDATSGCF